MNDFEKEVIGHLIDLKQRTTSMETKIEALPCTIHGDDIIALKYSKTFFLGACFGISAIVSAAVSMLAFIFKS